MKFSDIIQEDWSRLQPYLDTCLLPITGLSGLEEPWELTQALEQLRDLMDLVEIPYKGRMITYPAVHYGATSPDFPVQIDQLCNGIKKTGMVYVVLITSRKEVGRLKFNQADLMIGPILPGIEPSIYKKMISDQVVAMWSKEPSVKL